MRTTDPSVSERLLVAHARRGDELAWERLVADHQEGVFRLAYLFLGDADDAQDVAQMAFIRAYMKLDRYDDSRPLRPWLMSIAANLARNKRRSLGRYWGAIQRFLQANHGEAAAARPADRSDAELLRKAVEKLSPTFREIVYLRFFLDMSEGETADILGIARGTVKSRSHRALKELRLVITTEFPELADERSSNRNI